MHAAVALRTSAIKPSGPQPKTRTLSWPVHRPMAVVIMDETHGLLYVIGIPLTCVASLSAWNESEVASDSVPPLAFSISSISGCASGSSASFSTSDSSCARRRGPRAERCTTQAGEDGLLVTLGREVPVTNTEAKRLGMLLMARRWSWNHSRRPMKFS